MEKFGAGDVIQTVKGTPLKVVRHLAEGGQGDVYIVEHEGKQRALKWYKPAKIKHPDKFYKNLNENARRGAPDEIFLWPITATLQDKNGSFGYVMELREPGYHEFTEFLTDPANVHFTTFKAAVEACLKIVQAFRVLHQHGYCYQDMNDGNFFINPKTGQVLICDNDNVAPNGGDTFILGTPRYMAPEIVAPEIVGKDRVQPSFTTDYWSLSVILFMVLCMNHPLEGERWLVPLLTPANERVLYGTEATFIYDSDNANNRPNRKVHRNVIKRWPAMPKYVKDAFLCAFSQEAIRNPARRLREMDWMRVLVRFQSEIRRCQNPKCGAEVFINNAQNTPCDVCGQVLNVHHRIRFQDYAVAAFKGARIYRCQLETCNAADALIQVGSIVENRERPGVPFFLNRTDRVLTGTTPKGTVKQIPPGTVVPVKHGITIQAYGGSFMFED